MAISADEALAKALRLIDRAWQQTGTGPFTQRDDGIPVDRLPDVSEAAAITRSARARALIADIDALHTTALPGKIATTLAFARANASRWAREADWYWLVFDPSTVGFFAMFAPTAYGGAFLLSSLRPLLAACRFDSSGDVDRYLGLVADYARLVRQLDDRTIGQAARGIRMPRVQLDQAIAVMTGLRAAAPAALSVDRARLAAVDADDAMARIAARIAADVVPAFDRALATLADPAYRAAAPEAVGLGQYPGGAEVYAELIRLHLTLDMTAGEVHAAGHARMAGIQRQMQALFDDIGFAGNPAAYLESVAADPAWRAADAGAIAAVFRRYIDRIAPHIGDYFSSTPRAPHDVEPLAPALSASMTFGYYDAPTASQPVGRYVFNAENLARNALPNVAAITYHELVPGHHFHIASQRENVDLHPLRRAAFVNAFNEGWAEYAANLAGEMGLYRAPEERFGRLMMDAFLTCRLVVDTGMNALGWSLEQARDYLRAHAFMPETEVCSESIRYSCDIPGQSLAYKLGDTYLLALRDDMRQALGDRFDIRDFHDAVLKPGALPLPMVAANVASATRRLAGTTV